MKLLIYAVISISGSGAVALLLSVFVEYKTKLKDEIHGKTATH